MCAGRCRFPVGGEQSGCLEERIFLTASDGRLNDRLHVYCYHRHDGKLLWHTRFSARRPPPLSARRHGRATPATDGKRLYLLFAPRPAALDFAGKPVWLRSLARNMVPSAIAGA